MNKVFTYRTDMFYGHAPVLTVEFAQYLKDFFDTQYRATEQQRHFLRNLWISVIEIEEQDYDLTFEQRGLSKKEPVVFSYEFTGAPVLSENFMNLLIQFLSGGHIPEIRNALLSLQKVSKGVQEPLSFTSCQLDYIYEIALLLHDSIYNEKFYLMEFILNSKEQLQNKLSEASLTKVFSEDMYQKLNSYNLEEKSLIHINSQTEAAVLKFLYRMKKTVESKEGFGIYDKRLLHDFCREFFKSFSFILKEDDYAYDVNEFLNKSAEKGLYVHQNPIVNNDPGFSRTFRYEVSVFKKSNLSPCMTSDFAENMMRFFNGGHNLEIQKAFRLFLSEHRKHESSVSQEMVHKKPVVFTYTFDEVDWDSIHQFKFDQKFFHHLNAFLMRGNTELTKETLKYFRDAVEMIH